MNRLLYSTYDLREYFTQNQQPRVENSENIIMGIRVMGAIITVPHAQNIGSFSLHMIVWNIKAIKYLLEVLRNFFLHHFFRYIVLWKGLVEFIGWS